MRLPEPVLVRPGRPDDAAALHALYVEAFRDATLPFTVYADGRAIAWLHEVLCREPPPVAVADREGVLLGAFEAALHGTDWHLNHVAVRADERRRGLGDRLLATFEAWGRARGAALFSLHVVEAKTDVVAWYARRGYQAEGRRFHLRLSIDATAARASSLVPDTDGLEAALASVRRQGFGRFTATHGTERIEIGLVGDATCRLLDPGSLPVEEAVAELRALFAGKREHLVLVGQPREPQVDGVLETWPAWRMVKRADAPKR